VIRLPNRQFVSDSARWVLDHDQICQGRDEVACELLFVELKTASIFTTKQK
jgi:hypothetical protein